MAQPTYDPLRALAIGTQAAGLVVIIMLETVLGDAARPWQGITLGLMVASALGIALARLYRHKRAQREQVRRRESADAREAKKEE
jgi:adenine/guanine phosphoribosyltransferase-like PRPP-binding protein